MAATTHGAAGTNTERVATAVRADGDPCLFCGSIIPEGADACPKCSRTRDGKKVSQASQAKGATGAATVKAVAGGKRTGGHGQAKSSHASASKHTQKAVSSQGSTGSQTAAPVNEVTAQDVLPQDNPAQENAASAAAVAAATASAQAPARPANVPPMPVAPKRPAPDASVAHVPSRSEIANGDEENKASAAGSIGAVAATAAVAGEAATKNAVSANGEFAGATPASVPGGHADAANTSGDATQRQTVESVGDQRKASAEAVAAAEALTRASARKQPTRRREPARSSQPTASAKRGTYLGNAQPYAQRRRRLIAAVCGVGVLAAIGFGVAANAGLFGGDEANGSDAPNSAVTQPGTTDNGSEDTKSGGSGAAGRTDSATNNKSGDADETTAESSSSEQAAAATDGSGAESAGTSQAASSAGSAAAVYSYSASDIWPAEVANPVYGYTLPQAPFGSGTGTSGWVGPSSADSYGSATGAGSGWTSQMQDEQLAALQQALDQAIARVEDYFLPLSGEKRYERQEIEQLTDFELYLARNEIYARHGRIFSIDELDRYFNSRKWYDGKYTAEVFNAMEGMLNEFEVANLELIKQVERERNSPYFRG